MSMQDEYLDEAALRAMVLADRLFDERCDCLESDDEMDYDPEDDAAAAEWFRLFGFASLACDCEACLCDCDEPSAERF